MTAADDLHILLPVPRTKAAHPQWLPLRALREAGMTRRAGHSQGPSQDDEPCLTQLAAECSLLAGKLRALPAHQRPDLNKELTDASVALAQIFNKLQDRER